MARTDWDRLVPHVGQPVTIDVQETPMRQVASVASVAGVVAQRSSGATGEITIVRYDEKDHPTPYNQDKYTVWADVRSHQSFKQFLSSTQDNQNFQEFVGGTVFLVKQDPGPDHWLETLPASVSTVFRKA
jgi:hypothetical protein